MGRCWQRYSLLFCLCLQMACEAPPAPEIRIALLSNFDGRTAIADEHVAGARLAITQVNQAGGLEVDGRKHQVRLLIEHTPMVPAQAMAVAQRIINQAEIVAIVGPVQSAAAIPVGTAAERAQRTPRALFR